MLANALFLTVYKGYNIFYNEENDAFESAGIKKFNLRDMKLALDFKVLGKKKRYLRVYGNQILFYYPTNIVETVKGVYVQLPKDAGFTKLYPNSSDRSFDLVIPNTEDDRLLVKQLAKNLKTAEQAVNKAYRLQSKEIEKVNWSLNNAAK
jgi:hypothetical protein